MMVCPASGPAAGHTIGSQSRTAGFPGERMATMVQTPSPAPGLPVARRRSRLVWRNTVLGWSFILPNFLGFALLTMVPVGVLFYIAFTKWNVFRSTSTWIGTKNFVQLWHDSLFWTSL